MEQSCPYIYNRASTNTKKQRPGVPSELNETCKLQVFLNVWEERTIGWEHIRIKELPVPVILKTSKTPQQFSPKN